MISFAVTAKLICVFVFAHADCWFSHEVAHYHDQNLSHYMSHLVRKLAMWFPTRSDTNRAVQAQKMARGWKFWFKKVEELYYTCSKNKGVHQRAYADCWFSHEEALMYIHDHI